MQFNDFSELTELTDEDLLLVCEATTLALRKIKLSTLKQYIGVASPQATIPTDCCLWLKADKGVVLNNDTVSVWADQSGNNYNASQSVKAYQLLLISNAVNSLPALRFDGVDYFLYSDSGIGILGNRAIFLVFKRNQYAQNAGIFSLRSSQYVDWNSSDGMAITNASTPNELAIVYGVAYNGSNPGSDIIDLKIAAQVNSFYILNLKLDDNLAKVTLNSSVTATDTYQINHSLNAGGYVIGARGSDGSNSNGRQFSLYGSTDIAEIIVYKRALNTSEEQAVTNYLNTKYKIY